MDKQLLKKPATKHLARNRHRAKEVFRKKMKKLESKMISNEVIARLREGL